MLPSFTQLQNRSFHDAVRMRTAAKCKNETMYVQSVKKYCFSLLNVQICDPLVAIMLSLNLYDKLPITSLMPIGGKIILVFDNQFNTTTVKNNNDNFCNWVTRLLIDN